MKRGHMAMAGVMVLFLSGCAGSRTSQELKRLQSQVGLLDERISQLERATPGWQATEPLQEPAMGSSLPAGEESAPGSAKRASKISASTALKPSTRDIQQALKNSGFYQGAVDGKMGPMTKEAVREFQRVHGLKDDGVVGKQTWAKLNAYANLSDTSGEATAAEILK